MAGIRGKNSKIKTVAIALACVLAIGAVAGVAAHIVDNNYNPVTLDGKSRKVSGVTGFTNSTGVLTYTGDLEKYNESSEDLESTEDEEEDTVTTTSSDTDSDTIYTCKKVSEFVEVSSPLDDEYPFNQIKTVKDKYNNAFVQFPKMYMCYSYNRAGYLDGISFANYKVNDDYFISDAYLKQDGSGEYGDYFYIGCYEASGTYEEQTVDGEATTVLAKISSVASATPVVNQTRAAFRTAARAYGTAKNYYNGYQQLDLPMYNIYAFLCSMYYKTDDIQSVWTDSVHCTAVVTTGSTSPISTMNGWNISTGAVKMLGVENMIDSAWEWCDGINFEKTKIYYQSNPNNFTDVIDLTSDVILDFERPTTSGYVELLKTGMTEKTQSITFPAYTSLTDSGYEDDGYWYSADGTVLGLGGCYSSGSRGGLWTFNGCDAADHSGASVGGRLCGRTLSGVSAA